MNSSTNPTPFPPATGLEVPILQELRATGGSDQVLPLCARVVRHFPSVGLAQELAQSDQRRLVRLVRRAGAVLHARGEVLRSRTVWELTDKGRRRIAQESRDSAPPEPPSPVPPPPTHQQIQGMLVEIGRWLGRHAQTEFQHYDVVWRSCKDSPRLSHVFEVQVAGSVDSALSRLKQAHETQRSRIYMIIADERSMDFAARRLRTAFPEIARVVVLVGLGELCRLYAALCPRADLLCQLAAAD